MHWKKVFNTESQKAFWEIIHDSKEKIVRLIFIPTDDDNSKHEDIKMDYEKFEDLCDFINRISKPK